MEDEHDPNAPAVPKPNTTPGKGTGKNGDPGRKPAPKKTPKPKSADQLARAVPCFFLS